MWMALRGRRLDDFKFRRQATVGSYIVDFICLEVGLVIELDGGQHNKEVDARRTRYLEEQGLTVVRFWNNEVVENFEGVLWAISEALRDRVSGDVR